MAVHFKGSWLTSPLMLLSNFIEGQPYDICLDAYHTAAEGSKKD